MLWAARLTPPCVLTSSHGSAASRTGSVWSPTTAAAPGTNSTTAPAIARRSLHERIMFPLGEPAPPPFASPGARSSKLDLTGCDRSGEHRLAQDSTAWLEREREHRDGTAACERGRDVVAHHRSLRRPDDP